LFEVETKRALTEWSFLTNHARVLICIAGDPDVRLRDVAAKVDITERNAYQLVTDLVAAGYVAKQRDGRRNRYHVLADRRLREPTAQERTVGELLDLLVGRFEGHE
jgi:DNA-binding MarR family transcriptional regulator